MTAPGVIEQVVRFTKDFAELADDTDPAIVDQPADDFVDAFVPVLGQLDSSTATVLSDETTAQALFDEYQSNECNSAQQRAAARITARFLAS